MTILVFGNSHTRQVAVAWLTQLMMPRHLLHNNVSLIFDKDAIRYELVNGSVVDVVTNSYVTMAPSMVRPCKILMPILLAGSIRVINTGLIISLQKTFPM